MELRLLGPIEVLVGGCHVDLGPPQRRAVLAALAFDAGHPVAMGVLAGRVWDDPPERAAALLYPHITRLRRALGEHAPIERRAGGYVLRAERDRVDVHRLDRLTEQARDPGLDDAARVPLLDEALRLWRGVPLTDLHGDWAARARHAIEQRYLSAAVAWAEVQSRLGRADAVITRLSGHGLRYPLVEPLAGALMRALCALGRPAEALEHYARVRVHLGEQLGTEPGPELRALHEEILRGDHDRGPAPDLADPGGAAIGTAPPRPAEGQERAGEPRHAGRADTAGPAGSATAPAVPTAPDREAPAQLPPAVAGFTGRSIELSWLDELLARPLDGVESMVVLVIAGTAGVGKTALALHWSHRAVDRFPDGQLHVDLRGYDPDRPRDPSEVLAGFLRALGVPASQVPAEVDERAARLRSVLARRRVLLMLDNAASAEQVRPLLPGSPSCAVVVTSRDALAGLVSRDGARRLELPLLPAADAVGLLRRVVGPRVDADPAAASELAERCARLPLALRVAGELAVARPATGLADLAEELADERHLLDRLAADGDPRAAVGAVLSWSYRHLPGPVARGFRLLGLHPGHDYDPYALAALGGGELPPARRAMEALARQHLVTPTGTDQYAAHDLLRAFAARMAEQHEPGPERRAARTRLFDHLLYAAATAMDHAYPVERRRRPRVTHPGWPCPDFASQAEAGQWLEAQRANLLAVAAYAADHGWPRHVVLLAETLFRDLNLRGHVDEALGLQRRALSAARAMGDTEGEAEALAGLGVAYGMQGRFPEAVEAYQAALDRFLLLGDALGQARMQHNLGVVALRRGDDTAATERLVESLACYREAGDRSGEVAALGGIATVAVRQKRYEEGLAHRLRALAIARDIGDRRGEAQQLNQLGTVNAALQRPREAEEQHWAALRISVEIGDRGRESEARYGLGAVATRRGNHRAAVKHHREALALAGRIGDVYGRTVILNGLGEALGALGRYGEAREAFTEALDLASRMGNGQEQARARAGLAAIHPVLSEDDAEPAGPARAHRGPYGDRASLRSGGRRPGRRPGGHVA
jgi:DNA-binding SARP family transcriptional activator/tetratricopeptide (TPR) repeat protein